MLEQQITKQNVRYLLRKDEMLKEHLYTPDKNIDEIIDEISKNISSNQYELKFNRSEMNGHQIFCAANVETKIVVRNLDRVLRRIFKIKQTNRETIIKQLISLLHANYGYCLTKLDITSFYESINVKKIIENMECSNLLTNSNLNLLRTIINKTSVNGVPRGVAFSATLSEYYLREFDRKLKLDPEVVYIARYVDDIIVVSFKNIKDNIVDILKKEFELDINPKKYSFLTVEKFRQNDAAITKQEIDYLGYDFIIYNNYKKNSEVQRKIDISISNKKCSKIKTKFIKASLEYVRTKDFESYFRRTKILTSNFNLSKTKNGILKTGIYYNYSLITDFSKLYELDKFKNSVIDGKNRIGVILVNTLKDWQKQKLKKMSFISGFKQNISVKLSEEKLIKLNRCWKYV